MRKEIGEKKKQKKKTGALFCHVYIKASRVSGASENGRTSQG